MEKFEDSNKIYFWVCLLLFSRTQNLPLCYRLARQGSGQMKERFVAAMIIYIAIIHAINFIVNMYIL